MSTALILASTSTQDQVQWTKSGNWPLMIGAIATLVFLFFTYRGRPVAARRGKEEKPWPILYGADGRRSTSKLTAFTWTAALLFGGVTLCAAALINKLPLADIGLDTLPEQYLVLLAVPYGSLVAAKLITQTKVEDKKLVKAPPATEAGLSTGSGPYAEGGFTAGDRGQRSLQDVQYLTFNALLLVYFVTALWTAHALPELPDWLVGLTGASAATFIAGKAVETEQPEITAVTQHQDTTDPSNDPDTDPSKNDWLLQVRGKHLHQPVCGKTGGAGNAKMVEGAQFMEPKDCVTVDGHDVVDVTFHGENGFDVKVKGQPAANATLRKR